MSRIVSQLDDQKDLATIKYVQFGVMNPDLIKRGSVCEVLTPDTYDNNEPKVNGLFDLHMGVIEYGRECLSCENTLELCPGHFGHIELALPIFNINYINIVMKLLNYVCFRCSNILFDKNDPKLLALLHGKKGGDRFKIIQNPKNINKSKLKQCKHNNGCFVYQPVKYVKVIGEKNKYVKDDVVKIFAEFSPEALKDESVAKRQRITSEMCYEILSRITPADCEFLGFSNQFCRPEWMLFTVLPIPPPAVRPSVKHNNDQRAEDDLTYELANIVKANNQLKQKIHSNAVEAVISNYRGYLQYHVTTYINNEIKGIPQSAQRSGRPLKALLQRFNAKEGRIRGNLMGKRVDYSSRSVISVDPNINIDEFGVPKKVAMSLTFPEVVTKYNIKHMYRLVRNGPTVYPGANSVKFMNTDCNGTQPPCEISLKFADIGEIIRTKKLKLGDVVHRHIQDGDIFLFNRQPSLHKMSMMAHKAVIMEYNTFRLNVTVCKPYNADFDGDEMNAHVPQSYQTRTELVEIAAVPQQIISPSKLSPLIVLVQDTLLGSYILTSKDKHGSTVSRKQFYNYMMFDPNFDGIIPEPETKANRWTGSQMISGVIPDISLKTKSGEDTQTYIRNGTLETGILDKGILSKVVHSTYNQYNPRVCQQFLDGCQRLVTRWMETNGFTISFGDAVIGKGNVEKIDEIIEANIKKANELIIKTQHGLYEPLLDDEYRLESFEQEMMSILGSIKGIEDIIKNEVSDQNNIKNTVTSGSKGSKINMVQIMANVGQQAVMGNRIAFGFTQRTLPHFHKLDYSPASRGYTKNSYIKGTTPDELFFQFVSGRVGIIDTAIKTGKSGYMERRMVKGGENVKIEYDMTVRDSSGTIIQFNYGDDSMDPVKLEKVSIYFVDSNKGGYNDNQMAEEYKFTSEELKELKLSSNANKKAKEKLDKNFEELMKMRDTIRNKYYKKLNRNDSTFTSPLNFNRLVQYVKDKFNIMPHSVSDLDPIYVIGELEKVYEFIKDNYKERDSAHLLIAQIAGSISPKQCVIKHRLLKAAFDILILNVKNKILSSFIQSGDLVGVVAAQSVGEILTQMTLNTFHLAGVSGKAIVTTSGVPRIDEIISLIKEIKIPSMMLYLADEYALNKAKALTKISELETIYIQDIIQKTDIMFDQRNNASDANNTSVSIFDDEEMEYMSLHKEFEEIIGSRSEISDNKEEGQERCDMYSPWVLKFTFDKEYMMNNNITITEIYDTVQKSMKANANLNCIISDDNSSNIVLLLQIKQEYQVDDYLKFMMELEKYVLEIKIKGVQGINKVSLLSVPRVKYNVDGSKEQVSEWVLQTNGSNLLEIFNYDFVDHTRAASNSIYEIYNIYGIEAARTAIVEEFIQTIEATGNSVDYRHLALLADVMTNTGKLVPFTRSGVNNKKDLGPISKASFETVSDVLIKASAYSQKDDMASVSANVMFGQVAKCGTNLNDIYVDEEAIFDEDAIEYDEEDLEMATLMREIDEMFADSPVDVKKVTDADFEFDYPLDKMRFNIGTVKYTVIQPIIADRKTVDSTAKTTKTIRFNNGETQPLLEEDEPQSQEEEKTKKKKIKVKKIRIRKKPKSGLKE